MKLKEIRTKYKLSQLEAANLVSVPVRTFRRYENDDSYGSELKRQMFINIIVEHCEVTETKGLLTIEQIKNSIKELFESQHKSEIEFCYLFGSYAKGYAKEDSDIDLCVSTSLTGLKFVGLSEDIRNVLHKKIDLIRFSNLKDNLDLINEIMKDGIKLYG